MFGRRAHDLLTGATATGARPERTPAAEPGQRRPEAARSIEPPPSNERIKSSIIRLQNALYERIDAAAAAKLPRPDLHRQIQQMIGEIAVEERMSLSLREQDELATALVDDMFGLGPLEPLLRDDTIADIMVNGPKQIYIERKGRLELVDIKFRDDST